MILNVFLREDRDYVQGTQIIARSAETLGGTGWALRKAQFNKITRNLVKVTPQKPEGQPLGNVEFERNGHAVALHICEIETEAPQARTPMATSISREDGGDGNEAVFDYANMNSFEDILNVLVQATKKEHEHRFRGAHDIWFTGLRNISISCDPSTDIGQGQLRLSLLRQMGSHRQYQTMWNVQFQPENSLPPMSGMTTFVYKSDQGDHAN